MGSTLITPTLAINALRSVSFTQALRLPRVADTEGGDHSQRFVDIATPTGTTPADSINIRLLSHEIRKGMFEWLLGNSGGPIATATSNSSSNKSSSSNLQQQQQDQQQQQQQHVEPSKYLILQVHGGGFIAQSSKSHEIYLKPMAKSLCVPIVCVDYSLAPTHPFPRASEEVFYIYAWCLLNKSLLGWTGERIVCMGDSAGGLLVTNIVQRAIVAGVRVPDALVPIYAPFLCAYSLSPSRLMAVFDPMLNLGILWRCLAAYCGVDFKLIMRHRSILAHKGGKSTANSSDTSSENRIAKIYSLIGSSAFLIDQIRNHKYTTNEFMSPLLCDEAILAKFPKTCFIVSSCLFYNELYLQFLTNKQTNKQACNDPFLDDNIELAKRLRKIGVDIELNIVDNGVPHGFLNLRNLSDETRQSYEETVEIMRNVLADL